MHENSFFYFLLKERIDTSLKSQIGARYCNKRLYIL